MAAVIAAAIVTALVIESAVAVAIVYAAVYVAVAVAVSLVVNEILSATMGGGSSSFSGGDTGGYGGGNGSNVDTGSNKDPGVNSRLRINAENRVGVGYGTFWVKGAEVFGQSSNDFKEAYYALVFTEAIAGHNNSLQKAFWDEYDLTIGGDGWVTAAYDAAGNYVADFNGNVRVQFYANGLPGDRSGLPDITWFKTQSNSLSSYTCAVITVKYNRDKQIYSLRDMTFCLKNDLNTPGDVINDYMTNQLYGCGLLPAMVDSQSLTALNTYSNQVLPSTTSTGATVNLPRYRLDGVVNTNQNCWRNLESLMFACGCYPRVNNQTGTYGVFIDKAEDVISFAFDDTTMIGAMNITTAEYASVPNAVQVKFPRSTNPANGEADVKFKGQQDTFNLSLPAAVIPANTQENQYTLDYAFVLNDVQAKRLASVDLNNNALDLSVTFRANYKALGVVSGDVITITSEFNGWLNKKFRVLSMAEQEDPTTGNITLEFFVKEYDAAVYTDSTVVQYPPAANVNGPSIRYEQSFTPAAPIPTGIDLTIPVPSLSLQFTIPANKIEDQIDIYYMVGTPDINKAIFAFTVYGSQNDGSFGTGTFTFPVLGNGGLYAPQVVPPGDYYFACKYYNDGLASEWSGISTKVSWRPQTQQWIEQFAMFRWAEDAAGTAMTTNPDGKQFMGVYNSFNPVAPADPSLYQWFDLDSPITKSNQQFFRIYQNRVLSYRMALTNPDSTLYTSCYNFPDPANPIFNLDETTGFYVKTAYQAAGNNYLTSIWNADGSITYLLPKGTSVPGTTPITAIGGITVDIEGRVIGYTQNELIYVTIQEFTAATTNQTFSFVHETGQALIFMNGLLLDPTDYSETATGFTIPSTQSGFTVMAIAFKENTAAGEVAPYTRTDIPTVQGQTDYTVEMNEGCELVFINGSFLASVDYDTPINNVLRLNAPPPYANQNLTVVNFRPLNQVAAPFTQALGSTVGNKNVVEMNGAVNPLCALAQLNGCLLSDSDYAPTTDSIVMVLPAQYTGDIVQATSFVSSGPADPILPPFPPEQETLGDIIQSIETRLIQVENKI